MIKSKVWPWIGRKNTNRMETAYYPSLFSIESLLKERSSNKQSQSWLKYSVTGTVARPCQPPGESGDLHSCMLHQISLHKQSQCQIEWNNSTVCNCSGNIQCSKFSIWTGKGLYIQLFLRSLCQPDKLVRNQEPQISVKYFCSLITASTYHYNLLTQHLWSTALTDPTEHEYHPAKFPMRQIS